MTTGKFLTTKEGLKRYLSNTIPFSVGEFFRCSAFIGISVSVRDYLHINDKKKFSEKLSICFIAASCSSIVESLVGLIPESFNVVQSQIINAIPQSSAPQSISLSYYANFFRQTGLNKPRVLAPLYTTLLVKNFMANAAFTCADEGAKFRLR